MTQDCQSAGRRHRRPSPDWWPHADERSFAADLGLDVDWVAAKFRDHWLGVPGRASVKADWTATWRSWCRREVEFHARQPAGRRSGRAGDGSWMDHSIYDEAEPDRRPILDMTVEGWPLPVSAIITGHDASPAYAGMAR